VPEPGLKIKILLRIKVPKFGFKDKIKNRMRNLKNAIYTGSRNRQSLVDLTIPADFNGQLIVFIHGYMGFKDWGAWNLMEQFFTARGYGFCKFNISHNGGTVENGIDFPDLNAFAENNYSMEIADTLHVLDWLENELDTLPEICLAGHSRGGGTALLAASDSRVSKVITLSSICSVEQRFSDAEMISDWQEKGVRYGKNQRTHQEMPHNISQYTDFLENRSTLDIEKACRELHKPVMVIHGDEDTSVSITESERIATWTNTELHIIHGADHVYGASQPWLKDVLPEKLEEVCGYMLEFLQ